MICLQPTDPRGGGTQERGELLTRQERVAGHQREHLVDLSGRSPSVPGALVGCSSIEGEHAHTWRCVPACSAISSGNACQAWTRVFPSAADVATPMTSVGPSSALAPARRGRLMSACKVER